jgi:hypothetical protein
MKEISKRAHSSIVIASAENSLPVSGGTANWGGEMLASAAGSALPVLCRFPDERLVCNCSKLVRSRGKHLRGKDENAACLFPVRPHQVVEILQRVLRGTKFKTKLTQPHSMLAYSVCP